MKLNSRFCEYIGWLGAALILLAYALVAFQKLSVQNIWYPVMNLVGATAIVIHEGSQKDYAPTILNTVWALVALVALARLVFQI